MSSNANRQPGRPPPVAQTSIRPRHGAHTATPDLTPDHTADEKPSAAPSMSYHRGSSSAGGDDDAPSAWPSSLGNPKTAEL